MLAIHDSDEYSMLLDLRLKIPFLGLVPDNIYFMLSPSGFLVPDGPIAEICKSLENSLNHFIMPYQRGIANKAPAHRHLCGILEPAPLSAMEISQIEAVECALTKHRVNLVAYRKPITLSPIGKKYVS